MSETVRLTQYSHGAGCGCKIAPDVLKEILHSNFSGPDNKALLVGNNTSDDAAVLELGNGQALISTTDFFMPIVDDPYNFGRIASANAISDVYAMGGTPILAIAILGWPISQLGPEIAAKVVEGSRSICAEAGISLAGGHTIDSPEPIFGLAVNGLVETAHLKRNSTAREGDLLFLTKKLGVGILTTAEKKGILKDGDQHLAAAQMMLLNRIGAALGKITGVNAITDVTGFGLLGHLVEMAEGSGLSAVVEFSKVPLLTPALFEYIREKSVPGGTTRNFKAYGHKIGFSGELDRELARAILADPQTSGGLLIAVAENAVREVQELLRNSGLSEFAEPIGKLVGVNDHIVNVKP